MPLSNFFKAFNGIFDVMGITDNTNPYLKSNALDRSPKVLHFEASVQIILAKTIKSMTDNVVSSVSSSYSTSRSLYKLFKEINLTAFPHRSIGVKKTQGKRSKFVTKQGFKVNIPGLRDND